MSEGLKNIAEISCNISKSGWLDCNLNNSDGKIVSNHKTQGLQIHDDSIDWTEYESGRAGNNITIHVKKPINCAVYGDFIRCSKDTEAYHYLDD